MLAFSKHLCYYIQALRKRKQKSGCGEVWYRAWMGFKRPRVRISTLGPKSRNEHQLVPAFSCLVRFRTRGLLYYNHGLKQPVQSTALLRVRISTLGPRRDCSGNIDKYICWWYYCTKYSERSGKHNVLLFCKFRYDLPCSWYPYPVNNRAIGYILRCRHRPVPLSF